MLDLKPGTMQKMQNKTNQKNYCLFINFYIKNYCLLFSIWGSCNYLCLHANNKKRMMLKWDSHKNTKKTQMRNYYNY